MHNLLLIGDSFMVGAEHIPTKIAPILRQHVLIGSQGTAPAKHEGYSGQTWHWHLDSGPTANIPAFRAANGTPDDVVVLLGTNDMGLVAIGDQAVKLAEMMGYADSVVAAWQAIGARVYVCKMPGPCQYDAAYVATGVTRTTWESHVVAMNAEYAAHYETIWLSAVPGYWTDTDCFHPYYGYGRIAEQIAEAIGDTAGRDPA